MTGPTPHPQRFRGLSVAVVGATRPVPVATSVRARLLGLAFLDRAQAPPGLLIPRCRSVHTFGMRFPLDLHFLDAQGHEVSVRAGVRPGRLARERRACSVLELAADERGPS